MIVIQFLDSYIDDKIAHSPNFTGTITFNGTVSRDNDADGDRVITIGDLTLDVQFPDKNYSIIKSGSVKAVDETGKPYIEWTVSLSSYYNQSLNGYKLVDEKSVKQEDEYQQLDLFTDYEAQRKKQAEEEEKLERERRMQEAMLSIKKKFGKNAVLKGMNLEEGATAKDRNEQIGGHKA